MKKTSNVNKIKYTKHLTKTSHTFYAEIKNDTYLYNK